MFLWGAGHAAQAEGTTIPPDGDGVAGFDVSVVRTNNSNNYQYKGVGTWKASEGGFYLWAYYVYNPSGAPVGNGNYGVDWTGFSAAMAGAGVSFGELAPGGALNESMEDYFDANGNFTYFPDPDDPPPGPGDAGFDADGDGIPDIADNTPNGEVPDPSDFDSWVPQGAAASGLTADGRYWFIMPTGGAGESGKTGWMYVVGENGSLEATQVQQGYGPGTGIFGSGWGSYTTGAENPGALPDANPPSVDFRGSLDAMQAYGNSLGYGPRSGWTADQYNAVQDAMNSAQSNGYSTPPSPPSGTPPPANGDAGAGVDGVYTPGTNTEQGLKNLENEMERANQSLNDLKEKSDVEIENQGKQIEQGNSQLKKSEEGNKTLKEIEGDLDDMKRKLDALKTAIENGADKVADAVASGGGGSGGDGTTYGEGEGEADGMQPLEDMGADPGDFDGMSPTWLEDSVGNDPSLSFGFVIPMPDGSTLTLNASTLPAPGSALDDVRLLLRGLFLCLMTILFMRSCANYLKV